MGRNIHLSFTHLPTKQLLLLIGNGIMFVFLLSRQIMEIGTVSWVSFVGGCLFLPLLIPLQYFHASLIRYSQLYQQLTSLWSRIFFSGKLIIGLAILVTLGGTLLLVFPHSTDLFYSFLLGGMLTASILGLGSLIWRISFADHNQR